MFKKQLLFTICLAATFSLISSHGYSTAHHSTTPPSTTPPTSKFLSPAQADASRGMWCGSCVFDGAKDEVAKQIECGRLIMPAAVPLLEKTLNETRNNKPECISQLVFMNEAFKAANYWGLEAVHECIKRGLKSEDVAKCQYCSIS